MKTSIVWLAALLISGCASTLPRTLTQAPPGNVQLSQVKGNVPAYKGTVVRWGGTIIAVENEADRTYVQILQKSLDTNGRPKDENVSDGRFLMQVDKFLDPAMYAEGLDITVYGTVDSEAERLVGQYPLKMPVVRATQHYLWKEYERARVYYPYPYYWDYYPYGFYRGYWGYYPYW